MASESSTCASNYKHVLSFFLRQYNERIRINPNVERLDLKIEGSLPEIEKKILKGIVRIHNEIPEVYESLKRFIK